MPIPSNLSAATVAASLHHHIRSLIHGRITPQRAKAEALEARCWVFCRSCDPRPMRGLDLIESLAEDLAEEADKQID